MGIACDRAIRHGVDPDAVETGFFCCELKVPGAVVDPVWRIADPAVVVFMEFNNRTGAAADWPELAKEIVSIITNFYF